LPAEGCDASLPGSIQSPPPASLSSECNSRSNSSLQQSQQPNANRQVELRGAESTIPRVTGFFQSRNPAWRYRDDTPLHIACMEADLSRVKRILKEYPESVSALAADGDLPIHRAVASGSENALDILKELLAVAPNQINTQGMDGEYPLHIACAFASSVMLVHYLMSLQPETVSKPNFRGDLPIHRACMNRGPERDSIVKAVVETVPESVEKPGAQGHLPLHRACFSSTLASVKFLIGHNPDALRKADAKGQVPHTHSINLTHPLGPPIVPRAVDVLCPCSCK